MRNALSVIAGCLFIAGFVPYVRAILRKETQPVKASWIIWISLDTITLAGMFAKGSTNGLILGAVLGGWIVVILALKYGAPGWTKLDKICLGGAILGILLWQVFNDPTLGIVTSLATVFLGSIPTFSSARKDPGRENRTAWTIFWVSCACGVAAIPQWTLADAAQPVTFFAVETTMMYLLYRPRKAFDPAHP